MSNVFNTVTALHANIAALEKTIMLAPDDEREALRETLDAMAKIVDGMVIDDNVVDSPDGMSGATRHMINDLNRNSERIPDTNPNIAYENPSTNRVKRYTAGNSSQRIQDADLIAKLQIGLDLVKYMDRPDVYGPPDFYELLSYGVPTGAYCIRGVAGYMSDLCEITGGLFLDGVFNNGEFNNGVFSGGEFNGGEFTGGNFYGGVFHGGLFIYGVFKAGTFHNGDYDGGEFDGGVYYGGTYYGGVFTGGIYWGGDYHGGEFYGSHVIYAGVFYGGEFCDNLIINGGTYHGGVFVDGEFNERGPDANFASKDRSFHFSDGEYHGGKSIGIDIVQHTVANDNGTAQWTATIPLDHNLAVVDADGNVVYTYCDV